MTASTTVDRFRTAMEKGDLAGLEELLTPDIRFYSSMKLQPTEGRDTVMGLFGVFVRTLEDFRYVGSYTGSCETSADGSEAESVVLVFRTAVGGDELHGIDLLHFDEEGLIKEFTAMVRPQAAAEALGRAVLEGLIADGLVPPPAPAAE
ncbi:nuclear transport factor 2 family protein [Kitasatospora sp. NBC_00240]|uniref:nuclear transport factor 2 family protein n=1 Tax=Kitasatospora sp. NBC_00240 TaxID=2903567 RepID=UPI0022567458|nr:nuclear transport factor 2 family protein [Kitasatospora sp. NBC_00240]MCX5213314.1 nuclear transport factor 2 family protein [Kitasatospora sp. NBC_00240]